MGVSPGRYVQVQGISDATIIYFKRNVKSLSHRLRLQMGYFKDFSSSRVHCQVVWPSGDIDGLDSLASEKGEILRAYKIPEKSIGLAGHSSGFNKASARIQF